LIFFCLILENQPGGLVVQILNRYFHLCYNIFVILGKIGDKFVWNWAAAKKKADQTFFIVSVFPEMYIRFFGRRQAEMHGQNLVSPHLVTKGGFFTSK
jgi:hypothetical protein